MMAGTHNWFVRWHAERSADAFVVAVIWYDAFDARDDGRRRAHKVRRDGGVRIGGCDTDVAAAARRERGVEDSVRRAACCDADEKVRAEGGEARSSAGRCVRRGDGDVGARNAVDGDGEVRGVGKISADDGELFVALDEAGGAYAQ